jgi:hypothetical protein
VEEAEVIVLLLLMDNMFLVHQMSNLAIRLIKMDLMEMFLEIRLLDSRVKDFRLLRKCQVPPNYNWSKTGAEEHEDIKDIGIGEGF